MAASSMSEVLQQLRRVMLPGEGAERTDGQLLGDYVRTRDEGALAALVRRHGPMVWGVCRRALRSYHDAEDAFQATFLVLVRKAASVAARELLANWLYGVARQTALKARATASRRKGRERQVTEMPEPAAAEQDLWPELQPILDEELGRLPDKYRSVIVLCDLQEKTRKEAAGHLGCPEGTVAGRLARARGMLAKRLAQRGVALSSGTLPAVLAWNVAQAGVPRSVMCATIKAASLFAAGQGADGISAKVASLTEGVLKSMFLTKLKSVMVLTLMVAALVGLGAELLLPGTAGSQNESKKGEYEGVNPSPVRAAPRPGAWTPEARSKQDEESKRPEAGDRSALQGTWQVVSVERGGKTMPMQRDEQWVVKGQMISVQGKGTRGLELAVIPLSAVFKVDANKTPREIDINPYVIGAGLGEADIDRGIYTLDGDVWKICLPRMPLVPGKEDRPKEMRTKQGGKAVLITLKRVKPEQPGARSAPANTTRKGREQDAPATKPMATTARNVVLAYIDNDARGDETFLGKKLSVSGRVLRVERVVKGKGPRYLLTLYADPSEDRSGAVIVLPDRMPLAFLFPIESQKQLAELQGGQQVTIEGTCEGRTAEGRDAITFTACKIVKGKE